MKRLSVVIGFILSAIGIFQSFRYVTNYTNLSSYGKGYVWGSFIFLVCGIVLIYFGFRKSKKA